METNKTTPISPEEVKKYLEDFMRVFLRILVVTIAADMKKLSVVSIEDYLAILFFQYCVEKKITEARKHRASNSTKNTN